MSNKTIEQEQEEAAHNREVELYGLICNWHWFATHPDEPMWFMQHTSPESRAFANDVMKYMEKQANVQQE